MKRVKPRYRICRKTGEWKLQLAEIKSKPCITIINIAKEVLELAVKGDIQAIAVAGAFSSGESFNVYHAEDRVITLLGEISLMNRDYMDASGALRIDPYG